MSEGRRTKSGSVTRKLVMVAGIALLVMLCVTIADIAMKNFFNRPIKGTFELVEIAMVIVIFLGLPEVFRTESNVTVDIIDLLVSDRLLKLLKLFATISTVGFIATLIAAMYSPSRDALEYVQHQQETGIPTYALWVPVLLGTVAAAVATILVLVERLAVQKKTKQ